MNEQIKTDFLRRRMIQLREKNGFNLTQLATELKKDKSTLSRVEKIGGTTSFKTVHECAEEYCHFFNLGERQTNMFLRGERVVVVDDSALYKRPDILVELSEEYSCVFVPEFVIDNLENTAHDSRYSDSKGPIALEILDRIDSDSKIHRKDYSISQTSEMSLLDVAEIVSSEYTSDVDIITDDYHIARYIKGRITEKTPCTLIPFNEYYATRQNSIVNISALNAINGYYSDCYDDIDEKLGIEIPPPNAEEWDCYLADGKTLIISAVNDREHSFKERKEKIRWLINVKGADVDKRDCEQKNFPALTHAIRNHDYEMFDFLLNECGANPNVGSRNPYDVGTVRQKNNGNMPLMVAAWENQEEMVEELCKPEHKVSLNQQDGNGYTALIKACCRGNGRCRDLIEKAGADISILDQDGFNAEDRWKEHLRKGRRCD